MNYTQTENNPVYCQGENSIISFGGIVSTRIMNGLLLTEHERHICEVFHPTFQSLCLPLNDRIRKLEKYLSTLDQVKVEVDHEFIDGLYKRTMRVPAGTVLTGAIHKVKHMDVMIQGVMEVVTEDGIKTIEAPFTMTTEIGVKKCGIAITDVVWCTFHAAPYDTVEEMEAHIHSKNDEDLFIEHDSTGYAGLLNELGVTEETVNKQSLITIDMIEMPNEFSHIYKGKSSINGFGLFSRQDINLGDIICHARLKECRTIAGRFTNHSDSPNAKPMLDGENIIYQALEIIKAGSEITINYRDSIKVNPII